MSPVYWTSDARKVPHAAPAERLPWRRARRRTRTVEDAERETLHTTREVIGMWIGGVCWLGVALCLLTLAGLWGAP